MKRKLLLGLVPTLLALLASGCGGGDSGSKSEQQQPVKEIVVSFYIDFNQPNSDEVYTTQTVKSGEKVTAPETPKTAPFKEFPVFLGWSEKEIISSKDDLWNFETDTVDSDSGRFSIFGIWVAEGEGA